MLKIGKLKGKKSALEGKILLHLAQLKVKKLA